MQYMYRVAFSVIILFVKINIQNKVLSIHLIITELQHY